MQLILISGMAGAGKSTALNILEDSGYYCVDNLPPPLLKQLVELYLLHSDMDKIAVSIDTRSHSLLKQVPNEIKALLKSDIDVKVIFLDARNEVLLNRFSETRRKHPLSDGQNTINDCIKEERELLAEIVSIAHKIDTSYLSANHLRSYIKQLVKADYSQLNIVLQSFGFKYGVPIDSDFVFDVRCLANPYYDKNIRDFNGLEAPIIEFLEKEPKVQVMIDDISGFISKWLESFSQDNRNYLTLSIGCTGGKHRSVYIVEKIAQLINKLGYKIVTRHRQINS